ncbi:MAG: hypothetical protein KGL63_05005 [Betaproteobacteria bacterium]|nr:hypothetical protein [Betaproteobacteria bacterium]
MGEARRKREARDDAYASGEVFKPEPKRPACASRKVRRLTADEMPSRLNKAFACELEICLDCRAVWEAFPAEGYIEDPVCAEPCDNCAFRPGSPEQRDPEKWKSLIASLKPDETGMFTGRFYCHKGVPIDLSEGPGNFLYPQKPVMVDGEPLLNPTTGEPEMTWDTARFRTCSGFLRMFWQRLAKQEAMKENSDG